MKLISRDEHRYLFLIGKVEREMFFSLLRRYPVLIAGHFRARHPPKTDEARKNQDLLEEALAEQQKENRKQVETLLGETGRFTETDFGHTFSLNHSEFEWLLQVLNDIRVGSWIQLGEPGPETEVELPVTEQNIQLTWARDLAELFQFSLLAAAGAAE